MKPGRTQWNLFRLDVKTSWFQENPVKPGKPDVVDIPRPQPLATGQSKNKIGSTLKENQSLFKEKKQIEILKSDWMSFYFENEFSFLSNGGRWRQMRWLQFETIQSREMDLQIIRSKWRTWWFLLIIDRFTIDRPIDRRRRRLGVGPPLPIRRRRRRRRRRFWSIRRRPVNFVCVRVSTEFYRVLPSFTEFLFYYLSLMRLFGLNSLLLNFDDPIKVAGFFKDIGLMSTGFSWITEFLTEFSRMYLIRLGFDQVWTSFTGLYWVLLGFT